MGNLRALLKGVGIPEDLKRQLLEADNWISVEDELPVSEIDYLVYEDTYGSALVVGWDCEGKQWLIDENVTHWQPITPPKDGDSK